MKSLVVVGGGVGRPNLVYIPGPGLWTLELLDLTWSRPGSGPGPGPELDNTILHIHES